MSRTILSYFFRVSVNLRRAIRSKFICKTMASRSKMSIFSTPSGKGRNRRKCKWRSNIEIEPRTKTFGHCTVGSRIGSGRRNQTMGQRQLCLSDLISITHLCLFLVTVIFNVQTKNIMIGSHNLHQFKTASSYHKSCLQTHGGIWMAQELWLTEQQLPLLHQLGMQFFARSGMEESVSSGVFRGRPHRGVSMGQFKRVVSIIDSSFVFYEARLHP